MFTGTSHAKKCGRDLSFKTHALSMYIMLMDDSNGAGLVFTYSSCDINGLLNQGDQKKHHKP